MVTAPTVTDVIAISTLVDNHYYNEGNDIILIPSRITSPYSLSADDIITVTTFNNALGTKLRREVLEGKSNGIFALRFEPLNAGYTTAWLNGTQLIKDYDFTLTGNTLTVIGKTITASDRLDVMYFALGSATRATGYRIFKDMLNRTFYKRISKTNTTEIANDLLPEESTIQVKDGTKLPEVTGITPGVIFVDKERIEYFIKSGDTLSQLRRGTLGTGIKDHRSGTEVVDASGIQTIPYADTVNTNTFTGNGSTTAFALSQAPTDARQLDIFIGGQRLLLTSEDGSTVNYWIGGNDTDITKASFSKVSASLNSQDNDVRDVKWNNDGTKMFMLGRANDGVYEYSASTVWDVSTISFVYKLDISEVSDAGDNAANSISFNTDGTKLFVLGQGQDQVDEYALTTGFDLSTASYTHSFSVGSQEASPYGLAFSNDGTKMFVTGWLGDDINEYTLSTGFDVSTATFVDAYSLPVGSAKPSAVQFDVDGTTMYVLNGTGLPEIYQYKLATAWDVSTASYSNKSFAVTDQETKPRGFCFGDGGTKLYVAGWTGDDINQYTLELNLVLNTPPALGTQIKILHKRGQVWYTGADGNPANGQGLQASITQQAKFIAGEPTNAPE